MENLVLPIVKSGLLFQKTSKIIAGIAALCMFFLVFKPVSLKILMYKAFREASEKRMMWETRSFSELHSPHFIIRYHSEDSDIAQMVLDTAENSFQPVSSNFRPVVKDPVLIVIYPSREALGRSFGWAADESAMGVYWAGVIRVLSPSAWIEADNEAEVKHVFETQGPMAHELAHLMVDHITDGNYSRWFTEGIAQYIEVKEAGVLLEERSLTHPGELYLLNEMDREFDNLPDQSLAYYQSYLAIRYLVDIYGEKALGNLMDKLSQGNSMENSFQSELNQSMAQFEDNFKKWAVQKV